MIVRKKIDRIEFGLFSPEMIRKLSSVKIFTPNTYDEDGYPIEGGLMDPRLGVIDPGIRCKTCSGRLGECQGHFGHIELIRPVVHVGYAKEIYRLLRITCRACSRLLIPEEKLKEYYSQNLEKGEVWSKSEKVTDNGGDCPHCGEKQIKVKFVRPYSYYEGDSSLLVTDIREKFEKIQDDDLKLLGLKIRPEWMVLSCIPVLPIIARPSITLESADRSEDDLTHKLVDILRINQRLEENINSGAPQLIIEDLWDLLQYHVATYFDNGITGIPPARHRSGRPLKTIAQRLKGKEGRFRNNLSGKRVNFSARTVIGPDPNISINEVAVPYLIAMELTLPEEVNERNIKNLKKLILNGPERYPSAHNVITPNGRKRVMEENKKEIAKNLQEGDVVERNIMDGDLVVFNRQPSLHRISMMCHDVKVLPYNTFRLNTAVCVAPETNVLLSNSIQRKIEELRNCWKESYLLTYDFGQKKLKSTDLKKFWGLKPKEYNIKCYKITTKTNREVIVTEDHPFYTNKGILKARNLKVGIKAVVYPIDSPKYKEGDKIIISEEEIMKAAPRETYIKRTIKELARRELLPLKLNNWKVMILARLLGHLFGDGTLIVKGDSSRVIFRADREDLKEIQRDIKALGFEPELIKERKYEGKIYTVKGKILKVSGVMCSFELRNKPLGVLFKALGAPNGDKTLLEYGVPKWILKAPKHIKREFIAAYFGCELTKPTVRKRCKNRFRQLTFKVSKPEDKVNSAIKFIKDVKKILEEFNVTISSISKESGNIRKDGNKTIVITARFADNTDNLINFFGKIGYAYRRKADNLARVAYEYLIHKRDEIENRKNARKDAYRLHKKGYTIKEISKLVGVPFNTIDGWFYRKRKSGLALNFPTFESWIQENAKGLENGLVWEEIRSIENVECPYVYDVTTTLKTHNFFANGFLTKNCAPYNADFDGDEMNLHAPQSEEAIAEGEILMKVQECIISPRFGKPVIGGRHDHVTGTYLLTRKGSRFTKAEVLKFTKDLVKLPEGKKEFTGKEIFSLLLPKSFSIEYKGNLCKKHDECKKRKCEEDTYVVIKNGNLLSGVIDSEGLSGTLLNELFIKYGPDTAKEFIDRSTKLAIRMLMWYGFSIGIDEEDLPKKARNKIKKILAKREGMVDELIRRYKKGKLKPIPGKSKEESLEDYIMLELSKARSEAGKVAEEFVKKKSSVIMAKTGARGSLLNLTQMAGTVGQQAVRGKRIKRGYFSRTLSHFKKGDVSAEANGFVKSNFKTGLSLTEYFFHSMGGRESLVDTAIRTGRSGYMQRRLINALQDLKVHTDFTVRGSSNTIVQFKYGGDGIDPMKKGFSSEKEKSLVVPGEAVGTVAAQSIGEPGTQMSIPSTEGVIVKINGQMKIKPIGEFVDKLMKHYEVEKINETEVCDLPSDVQIEVPSLNEKGRIEWKKLKSCSRHYYSKKLIHIKTRSGREIIATDNHSFVIRKDNKILPILGRKLKPKDRIPVIKNLPLDDPPTSLEISNYLPKEEWWYGSELKKALSMRNNLGFPHYTIPVAQDQLRNYMKGENSFEILDGFVYPYQVHGRGKIPECFKLDSMLGWFLGAYLSEGSISKYFVSISNTNEAFLSKAREFAKALSLSYREKDNYRGFARGHDLIISSRVLVEFLERTCGKGSKKKGIPEFAYNADEAFIGSLLRGYFDGDGNISLERRVIRASSSSKELIDGIALLLSRLGIFARKSTHNGQYWISISYKYAKIFREKIGFDTLEKVRRLEKLCQIQPRKNYDLVEMIPGIGQLFKKLAKKVGLQIRLVNNFTKRQRIGKATLKKYTKLFEKMARKKGINISKEIALLRQMLSEDVVWDEIVEIKYTKLKNERVYDFSVEGLETFTTSDGVITHNTLRTFHYAGVAELAVPLGLPRLIEIIDAKKSPSNPMMTIFLSEKHSKDKEFVDRLSEELQEKFFKDVCKIEIDIGKKELKIETQDKDAKKILEKISEKNLKDKFIIKQKSLLELKKLVNKLEKKRLSGIKGIKRVFVRKLNEEWVIYTEGSNLKSVLNVNDVDKKRTTTNDIQQIYETLGIEAARNAIMNEAMNVLKEQKLEVDIRHIMLVADRMCVTGELQAVGRTGISGAKDSVLARAAFEETEKHILNAALYGETDSLTGVAENIIIGQPIPVGTGTVELEVGKISKNQKK